MTLHPPASGPRPSALLGSTIAALLALGSSGCFTPVERQCPSCAVLRVARPRLHLGPRTRRLFVLVPGALGFGWEWDEAVAMLEAAPEVDFVVFPWDPWRSLRRASSELAAVLDATMFVLPDKVREVVVVAHSAGGMIAAHAAGQVRVPRDKRLRLAAIGTPFAGMQSSLLYGADDPIGSPMVLAVGGRFTHYPAPAPRVELCSYLTSWPPDPVMKPRFGGDPRAEVGPPGARRVEIPPHFDHNRVVAKVVRELLRSP